MSVFRPVLRHSPVLWLSLMAFGLLVLTLLAAACGAVRLSAGTLLAWFGGTADQESQLTWILLTQIRLPRIVLGLGCGVSLAVAGCTMQALFRNALAEPGLLGVSTGAALGASGMIALGYGGVYALPVAAFAGALAATSLVMLVGRLQADRGAQSLLLAGIAVNSICGSLIACLSWFASDEALRGIVFWMMGSLGGANWQSASLLLTLSLLLAGLILRDWRALNALLLGEAQAYHSGFDVVRVRRRLVVLNALLVGSSVALCGAIGFVGLMIPHLMRLLVGGNHRWLLPASALAGAALLVGADLLARTVIAPAELPIGLLTSLLGGPFFLYLLVQGGRRP